MRPASIRLGVRSPAPRAGVGPEARLASAGPWVGRPAEWERSRRGEGVVRGGRPSAASPAPRSRRVGSVDRVGSTTRAGGRPETGVGGADSVTPRGRFGVAVESLAGRYELEELIGSGGMASVY